MDNLEPNNTVDETVLEDDILRLSLRNHLLETVDRRKRLRTAYRTGFMTFSSILVVWVLVWQSNLPAEFIPTEIYIVDLPGVANTQIRRIETASNVRYVDGSIQIVNIPVRSTFVPVMSDRELLDIFDDRAYAMVADDNNTIHEFFLIGNTTSSDEFAIDIEIN